MIPTRRSRAFTRWFAGHADARLRRSFGRIHVRGVEDARRAGADAPLLLVANHTSWWDPLVALWLSVRHLGFDAYAMMDARNLRRLPFFGLVGGFGVDLDDPRDGARSVRHAASLLDRPGRAVWVYPEGRERSPFSPLELRAGAAHIAKLSTRARVVGIGVRYVFAGAEAPDLWISLGPAFERSRDIRSGLEAQRRAIETELARIDGARKGEFTLLHERRPSLFGRVAEVLLATLTRPLLLSGANEAAAGPESQAAPSPFERSRDDGPREGRKKDDVGEEGVVHGDP